MGVKTFDRANPSVKQIETYSNFTGGINTEQSDQKMVDSQFRDLVNFDMDLGGSLTKRQGLYRIPKINEKMEIAYVQAFSDPNEAQESLALRVVNDSFQFFDGVHWVINFITNQGLGVAILDKDLRVMENTDVLDPHFIFYRNIKDNVKISSYSDYYILIESKYMVNGTTELPEDSKAKQIKIYSWNPIPHNVELGNFNKKEWIEASTTQEQTNTETYYGEAESLIVSQETIGIPVKDLKSILIDVLDTDKNETWKMFDDLNLKVEFNSIDITLNFSWINPSPKNIKEYHKYKIKGTSDWSDDNSLIHQMVATHSSGYYWFTFYQPNRSLMLSLKLKDDLTSLTPSIIDNMPIYIENKGSFKSVAGVTSGLSRAEKFSMTEMGIPVVFTAEEPNRGMTSYRGDNTQSKGIAFGSYCKQFIDSLELGYADCDAIFDRNIIRKSKFWDLNNHNNSIFKNFGGKTGLITQLKDYILGGSLPLYNSYSNNPYLNLIVGDAEKSPASSDDTLRNVLSLDYIKVPNLSGSDAILWDYNINKESTSSNYGISTELLVPQISLNTNRNNKDKDFSSYLLPHPYSTNLPGVFWWHNALSPGYAYGDFEKLSPEIKNAVKSLSWMGMKIVDNDPGNPSGGTFQIGTTSFMIPGSPKTPDVSNGYYISDFNNPSIPPISSVHLFNISAPRATDPFIQDVFWNDKIVKLDASSTSSLKNHRIFAGNGKIGTNNYFQNSISTLLYVPKLDDIKKQKFFHSKFLNKDTGLWNVGFAYTGVNIKITLLSSDITSVPIPIDQFKFAGLKDNNLFVGSLKDLSSFDSLLILNGRPDLLDKLTTFVDWRQFLGAATLKSLLDFKDYNDKELLAVLRFTFSWTILGVVKTLDPNLSQNNTILLLKYILEADKPIFKIFGIKDSNNKLQSLKITTIIKDGNNSVLLILLDTSVTPDIPQSDYTELASTIQFKFAALYYPNGLVNNVIQFKKLIYTKPNLNDLVYLWYNFVLFNRNNIKNKIANPDIYDDSIYKKISTDLIQYPLNSALSLTRPVALYGMYPVNDVLLVPGDNQKFQIFFGIKPPDSGTLKRDIRVSLLAMPLADYTAMILSKDFDTSSSLQWKEWDTVFPPTEGNTSEIAIWNVTIPSTTSPYILVVQACEWKTPGTDETSVAGPNLSTVVETRLEMSPQSSVRDRLPIPSLFDEFTASTQLKMFETSSSVVIYGSSNKIFFSDIGVPTFFPCTRVIQLKTPESIVSTVMFQNKLIVSTENSRHYIGGTSFDSNDASERHSVKLISSDSGVIAHKFDVPFGDRLYFLDNNGIKFLKNLYGTSDKEFTFQEADLLIKEKVPLNDKEAVAIAHRDKLYINFPKSQKMLVYVKQYDSWLEYRSPLMEFSRLFAKDGELYGIAQRNFNIFKFDKNVMVDGWNEDIGWEKETALDGTTYDVQKDQKGINSTSRIICSFKTKNLDQSYTVHQKKYKQISINATLLGTSGFITPRVEIDHNLINYRFQLEELSDNNYLYKRYDKNAPAPITLINSQNFGSLDSQKLTGQERIRHQFILGQSRLGVTKDVNYIIPVREKGDTISLSVEFDSRSAIIINQIAVRFELRLPKKKSGR